MTRVRSTGVELPPALAGVGKTFEEVAGLLWQTDMDGDWSVPDIGVCPLRDTSSSGCGGRSSCAAPPIRSERTCDRSP